MSWPNARAFYLLIMTFAIQTFAAGRAVGTTWEFTASETLTTVEMNHGDTLRFTLRNGDVRTLVLEGTSVHILEKNEGGIVYTFACHVRVDSHPLTMRRYVCTPESFYEPYVINGMRIWPDSVLVIYDRVPMRYPRNGNLRFRVRRDARFAVQDATLPICPQPMKPWYPNDKDTIDVGDCYNGDDCWMGPYLGEACHGGLDINHRRGDPLWAPIDFDDQWNFNSLKAGHNNNRWRGVRQWSNGDVWALQTHHHIRLHVPEHTPLRAGIHYADAAGVHVGSHDHTHFELKVAHQPTNLPIDFDDDAEIETSGQPTVIHLDPWILFWQIFEAAKTQKGRLCATMKPLRPARTGQAVAFDATLSSGRGALRYYWTFGDGTWSNEPLPRHIYARPDIYPVTLTVDNGADLDRAVQWLTVDGQQVDLPALTLAAPDEPSFRRRPPEALDTYDASPKIIPHTLEFLARPSRPQPHARRVQIRNAGPGTLASTTICISGTDSPWLTVDASGAGNGQSLHVAVDAQDLDTGTHAALVEVTCPGAVNSPQHFRVLVEVPNSPPRANVIIDDADENCYRTPGFWVGHKFSRCRNRGYNGFYLTNGARPADGQYVRFTPDLAAGTYRVSLRPETPFHEGTTFPIRIHCASGDEMLTVNPAKSRIVGTFDFHEGTDGFVEIHAQDSSGLVIADAVEFTRIER
jgi:hypothetical protein